MEYATWQDLVDRFGEAEMVQLTDVDNNGVANTEKLQRVIDDAICLADGYLSQVYRLPLRGCLKPATSAGADLQLLLTGTADSFKKGIDNFDALAREVKASGVAADIAGPQLAKALNQVAAGAQTQQEIKQVIARFQDLGKQGVITGDQLRDGLNKARDKLAELTPGVNSLREAMQTLGLKSREELVATATKAQEAYGVVKSAGQQEGESYVAWQARKRQAAAAMLQAMIAANQGLTSEAIQTRAAIEGLTISIDASGKATVNMAETGSAAMNQLGLASEGAAAKVEGIGDAADKAADKLLRMRQIQAGGNPAGSSAVPSRAVTAVDNTGLSSLQEKERAGTLAAEDKETAAMVFRAASANLQTYQQNQSAYSDEGARSITQNYNAAKLLLEKVQNLERQQQLADRRRTEEEKQKSEVRNPQPSGTPTTSAGGGQYTVNLTFNGGNPTRIQVASQADAQALLAALQEAQRLAGG